jgi:DNA ligase-1
MEQICFRDKPISSLFLRGFLEAYLLLHTVLDVVGLPPVALDGELWMGRESDSTVVLNTIKNVEEKWKQVGYYVFDIPSSSAPYEQRMRELEALKPSLQSHVHIVEVIQCKGMEHLIGYLDSVVASNGEGVMVREPHSLYIPGLTSSLRKVKVFFGS